MVAIRGSRSGAGGTERACPSDEVIHRIISIGVVMTIREAISELFGLVKTLFIEDFDPHYSAVK